MLIFDCSLPRVLKKDSALRLLKTAQIQGARNPRGVSRTVQYVATTRGEGNAVDVRFSATC
jgi:hypothetical protein